jgi:protein phosphatase 2C family protein 2/3
MGDTLSTPNKEKHLDTGEDARFRFASCGMQGWRRGMEDAHTTVLSMPTRPGDSFFAVFDGHCGPPVAQFCGERVYRILGEQPLYAQGELEKALTRTFIQADEELKADEALHDTRAGTTAVAVLVTDTGRLVCANAGDSRAVLCRAGKALDLSIDHKPFLDSERARIEAAGGFVMLGRVNGNLALSRAIGTSIL